MDQIPVEFFNWRLIPTSTTSFKNYSKEAENQIVVNEEHKNTQKFFNL